MPTKSEMSSDPKVVWNADKKKYYIFIGAQTLDKRGCVLIYESEQLLSGWRFAGELKVPGYDGLYFHLDAPGDPSYTVKERDKIYVRYIRYTLDAIADTASYMNTTEQAYPTTFSYSAYETSVPTGWLVAVKYMKHSGASCKIICPSKQGLDTEKNSVTPYGYDMKIQFQRY